MRNAKAFKTFLQDFVNKRAEMHEVEYNNLFLEARELMNMDTIGTEAGFRKMLGNAHLVPITLIELFMVIVLRKFVEEDKKNPTNSFTLFLKDFIERKALHDVTVYNMHFFYARDILEFDTLRQEKDFIEGIQNFNKIPINIQPIFIAVIIRKLSILK
ncbi:hypothetical protein HOD29_05040 [archaeon]|jgi:hypothetical protein|nr:hypothetical protein [archaeon]